MSFGRRSALLILIAAAAVVPAALAGSGASPFTVRSTLDGRTVLPLRIHWIARPQLAASKVKEVDFLIDGRLGWVEHKAPYVYGDDGNWLVTSFLMAAKHTFTVRVISTTGAVARDTVTARVVPTPSPPASLAGTWSRTVMPADIQKATSSQPPPAGVWKITIETKGWHMTDPDNGGGLFDVAYLSPTRVQLRPTIETPPYPNPNNGGWCADTDPLSTYTATVSSDGSSLVLAPVTTDPCGDRAAIIEGTWTRKS